ncbi:MAG TPA: histidine kinase dimerization/phosphoacceptor domain-containing protein, partial [Streptosporangiaceae bacterium]|nr:histidine kinase dimerization/phosphoacceptor domain-containing protein [Streptosporangiaceae bacterium]
MNAQSPPVPAGTDEMAARQPGPARPAASPAPPLTMRIRRTHWVVLDYVVAAVCALIIFGTLFHGVALARLPVTGWHARDWLPPLLAVCLSIPVAIRRREPVLAFAVILAVCAGVLVLRGELTRGPVLPLALVLYVVAATRGRRAALTALAASLALLTVQGVILSLTGRGAGNAVGAALSLIICWMIGYSVGQRRSYAARLQQQAMDNAVTAERLRIARELHDVVAHSMTVVAVQAGFGEYVFDRQP